jgi:hypothetical protein
MRKLLIVSFVALAAGAVGCSRNQCGGTSMRSPCSLFGGGQPACQPYQQPYQNVGCGCDPCGGGGAAMGAMAAPGMMSQGMMSPAMMSPGMTTQAPCCGQ